MFRTDASPATMGAFCVREAATVSVPGLLVLPPLLRGIVSVSCQSRETAWQV